MRLSFGLPLVWMACGGENVIESKQNTAPVVVIASHSPNAEILEGTQKPLEQRYQMMTTSLKNSVWLGMSVIRLSVTGKRSILLESLTVMLRLVKKIQTSLQRFAIQQGQVDVQRSMLSSYQQTHQK